jgi:hypothetical protein
MMVQDAPAGEPHFITTMIEHNDFCARIARAFGNSRFQRPEPFELVVFVIGNHDRGWDEWDANPALDPKTGLPCGLTNTPTRASLETSRKSPEFNERHHPYSGLLSSMHSWGLYHARYGFSEFRVRAGGSMSVPIFPQFAEVTHEMLDGERARQERLKAELKRDPAMRGWVEEKHLMQNYKQLQFFDTLTLYFHLRHPSARAEEKYVHVPLDADTDTDVVLRPQGDNTYSLIPFPFARDHLEVCCRGRYLRPMQASEAASDLGALLRGLPTEEQVFTFVPG